FVAMPPDFTAEHYGGLKEVIASSKELSKQVGGTVGEDLTFCLKSLGNLSDRFHNEWKSIWHKDSPATTQQKRTKMVCISMIEALQKTLELIDHKSDYKLLNFVVPQGTKAAKPVFIHTPTPSPPAPPVLPSQSIVVSKEKRVDGVAAVASKQPTVLCQSANGVLVVAEKRLVEPTKDKTLQERYYDVVKKSNEMAERMRTMSSNFNMQSKQMAELLRYRQELREQLKKMTIERRLMIAHAEEAVKIIVDICHQLPSIGQLPEPIRDRMRRIIIEEILQKAKSMVTEDHTHSGQLSVGGPSIDLKEVAMAAIDNIDSVAVGRPAFSIIPRAIRQPTQNRPTNNASSIIPSANRQSSQNQLTNSASSIFPSANRQSSQNQL
ncbi:hypothetical protein PENTCL1PPCAC_19888, partial [Pristionchus entomophagus]